MSQDSKEDPTPNPASEGMNSILEEALEFGRPRFFRASKGVARGKSGKDDTEKFADHLMTIQECALLLGERLEMNSVAHGVIYDSEETVGFCFNQNSNPKNPELIGLMANRRVPMREALGSMREYINE